MGNGKQTVWISPTVLFYDYAQTDGLNFCSTISHRFTVKGKESDTIWSHENLPTFLLYGFIVTTTYLTSFLLVFLSSAYINTDRTWRIQFCLILFVSLFTFCYCLFCAVVWMIVMLKFWMLGFSVGVVFLVQYFVLWCSLNGCCPRILIKKKCWTNYLLFLLFTLNYLPQFRWLNS